MLDFLEEMRMTSKDFEGMEVAPYTLTQKEWFFMINAIPSWKENAEIKELIHKIEAEAFRHQRATRADKN